MDQDAINRDLRELSTASSPLQSKVREEVLRYIQASSDEMSNYWNSWDDLDKIYRGYRVSDKDDKKAEEKGEPSKIIVPVSYAQTQTAISFFISMFTQREYFFELQPTGSEDQKIAKGMEKDLNYQIHKMNFLLKLYCWLLDSCKYGVGIVKTGWTSEYVRMRTMTEIDPGLFQKLAGVFGLQIPTTRVETVQEVLCYEGNTLLNISPYSFYPDPDVPLFRFQEGAFVGHEEEVSMASLRGEEGAKYHGTEHIPSIESLDKFNLGDSRRRSRRKWRDIAHRKSSSNVKGVNSVVLTEVQFSLIPAEWKKELDIDLGDEKRPIKFVATIANDEKVIRFEPLNFLHGQYTYGVIEYSPDHNRFLNPGLSETIYELQNLMTWFLNSHIVNVREVVKSRMIFDPTKVHREDLTNNSRYVRLKSSTTDIDRAIKQLQVQDVTASHVNDMEVLNRMVQFVTGINENALGQYAQGRRSATEARNVSASAASRLRMHAMLFWLQGIQPVGKQFISNTRQGRSEDVYNMIVGDKVAESPFEQTIMADPMKLAGGYDLTMFEGILPTEKHAKAAILTELFTVLVQNPQTIQLLQKDPTKLLHHIAELHGIFLEDFSLDNPNIPPLPTQAPQAQVVPDEQVAAAADAGARGVDPLGGDLLQQLARGV